MRKIVVSALILFALIGLVLPASAGASDHKKPYEKVYKMPKPSHAFDVDVNTAIVTQTQIAVPISIGNKNTAWFGDAGSQSIYQNQYSELHQKNK